MIERYQVEDMYLIWVRFVKVGHRGDFKMLSLLTPVHLAQSQQQHCSFCFVLFIKPIKQSFISVRSEAFQPGLIFVFQE